MRGRGNIQKFEVDINFGMDFKVYTLDRVVSLHLLRISEG